MVRQAIKMHGVTDLLTYRWKTHMCPKRPSSSRINGKYLPALPPNKTVVEVLGDFMQYLFNCTRTYITETHSESLWGSIANNIDFVFTHPNGWEEAQQSQIRHAAILGGLDFDRLGGQSRIQLLAESEAILYFCFGMGLAIDEVRVCAL